MPMPEIVMTKLQGDMAAAQVKGMAGENFTIGKVTMAGNGMGNTVVLNPVGATGAAGKGAITLKIEGAKQAAGLQGFVGKTVAVGKAPMTEGGRWLVMKPGAAAAGKAAASGSAVAGGTQATGAASAGKGAAVAGKAAAGGSAAAGGTQAAGAAGAGKGAAAGKIALAKVEGGRQVLQVQGLVGKTFVVAPNTGAGNMLVLQPAAGSGKGLISLELAGKKQIMAVKGMVGKTVTVNTPLVTGKAGAGAGKWMFLKTVPGVGSKTAAGIAGTKSAVTAKALAGAKGATTAKALAVPKMMTVGQTVTSGSMVAKTAAVGKGTVAAGAAKSVAASGTIWTGTGWSLGLGLGLGALGPAIVAAAAVGYGYYRRRRADKGSKSDLDIVDAGG